LQAAAALMGLPKMLTCQFVFFQQINNNQTFLMKQEKSNMLITVSSLIAAGFATAVVTGGITGTAVYLTAGEADFVTGDQIKTEGGLHILVLGHMEPWAIAMMCATVLIGMGTCGACCHKREKIYVTAKEAKLRDHALGQAKELVHMGALGVDKLLQDVQTYHDMHQEIVMQKMHQITPPRTGESTGRGHAATPYARNAQSRETSPSVSAAASRRLRSSQAMRNKARRQLCQKLACRQQLARMQQLARRQQLAGRQQQTAGLMNKACRRYQQTAARQGRLRH
jgi:hypothetical protein